MRKFALLTVLPAVVAFGAGMAIDSRLTSPLHASAQAIPASLDPDAMQRDIDARTLPATEVQDFI